MVGLLIKQGASLIPLDPTSSNTTARLVVTGHGSKLLNHKWKLGLESYLAPRNMSDMMGRRIKRTLFVTPDYVIESLKSGELLPGIGPEHVYLRPLPNPLNIYPQAGSNGIVVQVQGFPKE